MVKYKQLPASAFLILKIPTPLIHLLTVLSSVFPPRHDSFPQLAERQILIDRLEEDLMASRSGRVSSHGGALSKPSASKLSGLVGGGAAHGAEGGGEDGDEAKQDSSMLRVLCSQRDR